jgi:hypothetical protein
MRIVIARLVWEFDISLGKDKGIPLFYSQTGTTGKFEVCVKSVERDEEKGVEG